MWLELMLQGFNEISSISHLNLNCQYWPQMVLPSPWWCCAQHSYWWIQGLPQSCKNNSSSSCLRPKHLCHIKSLLCTWIYFFQKCFAPFQHLLSVFCVPASLKTWFLSKWQIFLSKQPSSHRKKHSWYQRNTIIFHFVLLWAQCHATTFLFSTFKAIGHLQTFLKRTKPKTMLFPA